MLHTITLLLSLLPVLYAQKNESSLLNNVTQAFSQARIVPDILPSFTPTALADIIFPASSSGKPLNVTPGALLTKQQTAAEPTYFLIANNTSQVVNRTFVLAIVDPDAPAEFTPFLHFLGGGFSVNATSRDPTRLTNRSAALMEYFPPAPPTGSPPHRYILVVYPQPDDFADNARSVVNASTPRTSFNLTKFASSTNLTSAVAGNFFLVGSGNGTSTASSSTPTSTSPVGSSVSSAGVTSTVVSTVGASSAGITDTSGAPAPTNTSNGAISTAPIGLQSLFSLITLATIVKHLA